MKLFDYCDHRGINRIAAWTRELQPEDRAKLWAKLLILEKLSVDQLPGYGDIQASDRCQRVTRCAPADGLSGPGGKEHGDYATGRCGGERREAPKGNRRNGREVSAAHPSRQHEAVPA